MTAAATVRRLRVATSGQGGAATARALVEDALNTRAAAAGRGLLVLRRLDAGPATGPTARGRVAARVERALRAAAAQAVPADTPAAATARAVRFRDALEAYRLQAAALLGGGPLPWYLRAFFGERRDLPPRARFRALLLRAAAEPAAPAILAAVLAEAARLTPLAPILADLPQPARAALLAALTGGPQAAPAPPVGHAIPPAHRAAVGRQLARAPAPLLAQAGDALAGPLADTTARILVAAALAAARPGPVAPPALAIAERLLARTGRPRAAPAPDPLLPSVEAGAPPEPRSGGEAPRRTDTPPPGDPLRRSRPPRATAPTRPPPPAEPPPPEPTRDAATDTAGSPTRFAGAVLALALLARAAGPLLARPEAMAAELGRQALAAMLRRAGAPPPEPALAAFGPSGLGLPLTGPVPFSLPAPPRVRQSDLRLRRVAGHPGWRALTCRRGRILLGCWQGRRPAGLRARRAPPLAWSEAALVQTLELAARALARRLTGRPLRALLHRPGWIAADATHVDVTMPAGLVELAIRRAGLDFDPGWWPWLARVVAIRYDYGGHHA